MFVDAVASYQSRVSPERRAWGVLLISFALFCLVCLMATISVYVFFFESTQPLETSLRVGRGTVGLAEADLVARVVRNERDLTGLVSSISTDSQSQATIAFRVPGPEETGSRLIVSITLKNDTSIDLRSATMPRFEWGSGNSEIEIHNLVGEIDVLVFSEQIGDVRLRIYTRAGMLVELTQKGRYTISASDTQVRIINREGIAVLLGPNFEVSRAIPGGHQGIMLVGSSDITIAEARRNLVENGLFVLVDHAPGEDGSIALPARWGCRNDQDDLPRGSFSTEIIDGRSALRFVRADGARSHGETRCKQPFGEHGQDVTGYSVLELVATFYVQYQSLSECGIQGSECPLMLMLEYTDLNGIERRWFQGFYYAEDPNVDYPTLNHQKINEKSWFTYESGNLFTRFPADQIPSVIHNIQFYASGHQYDVYISELSLLVSPGETVPPETATAP